MSQDPLAGVYCLRCRTAIPAGAISCPHCGGDPRRPLTPEEARALRELDGQREPEGPSTKICPQCRREAAIDAKFCAECGHPYRTQFRPPPDTTRLGPPPPPQQQAQRPLPPSSYGQQSYQPPGPRMIYRPGQSPTGAILLGFFLTGGGQMLNGQVVKGVVTLVSSIVLGLATLGLASVLIWILAFIDAILIAQRLQRGEAVGEWQCF